MTESLKTLGVWLNPAGTWDVELQKKRNVSVKLAASLRQSALVSSEAEKLYWSVFLPKVGYSWGVTGFNLKDGDKVMSLFLREFLPKVGFNRNMPRAVIYGPQKYGGAGYARGYTHQCATALSDLVGHVRA